MPVNGQSAAGVTVPDTKLAREATELVRESAPPTWSTTTPAGSSCGAACRAATAG